MAKRRIRIRRSLKTNIDLIVDARVAAIVTELLAEFEEDQAIRQKTIEDQRKDIKELESRLDRYRKAQDVRDGLESRATVSRTRRKKKTVVRDYMVDYEDHEDPF